MRGFALLAFALLSFGPTGAQSLGPIAGKSIVFSIEGDAYPFILYTTPAGRVFLALGFAGEEFKCGWRGSFGLDAQIGRQRPARANARGPGCQFQVEGTTAAQYEGGRLDFTFDGSGQVTGPAGGGFLTKYAGQGAFPIQLAVAAEVRGDRCSIPVGGSVVNRDRYAWQVTSCYVASGRQIRQ